ncbi:MAG TPA: right-handed parallel beta-helix repeat-containing protein [Candidatus Krumholzibacteria bacterium]|nr:right-handed parallel beta-helix repeat-containing protein [Candidatus Krumholzibacteria bacterium]HRX52354.1 right-handed parallel beta-helix repeat-containing protein [Candidatus Krumholzibacteria bacterium]
MRPLIVPLPLALLLTAALTAPAGAARILTVPVDYATIDEALDHARVGDEVVLTSGTYLETQLRMRPGVILRGETGDPADVILDGQGVGPILFCLDIEERIGVHGITFRNGAGATGGAVDLRLRRGMDMSACVFEGNSSASQGGALSVIQVNDMDTENCIFTDLVFRDNTAELDGGGAVVVFAPVLFQNCEFLNNHCGRDGGGLFVPSHNTVLLECLFQENRADADGGAFDGNGRCRIELCTFRDNHADQSGGAVQIAESITDCVFEGNSAGGAGGAVLLAAESTRSEFVGNEAGLFGGAIASLNVGLDCLFRGNHAAYAGGAVSGARQLARCVFEDNSAAKGGALELNIGPNDFEDCEFRNNSALLEGGAVYAWGYVDVSTFLRCRFTANTAPAGPAGVYPAGQTCLLSCSLTDLADWEAEDLAVDDDECNVANESMGFGQLKRAYR